MPKKSRQVTGPQVLEDVPSSSRLRFRNWTLEKDTILLSILIEKQLAGDGIEGHFTTQQYQKATSTYIEKTGETNVRKDHIYNRYKALKKKYQVYSALKERSSGRAWNYDKNMPILTEQEWLELISVNKDYAQYQNVPFPQYDLMDAICGKNIAQGKEAWGTTENENSGKGSSTGDSDDHVDDVGLSQLNINSTNDIPAASSRSPPPEYAAYERPSSATTISSGSKRRRQSGGEASRSRRRRVSPEVDENLEIQRERNNILKSIMNRTPTVEECMEKINAIPGISDETAVWAVLILSKKENRVGFRSLGEGSRLLMWLNHKIRELNGS